MEKSLKDKLDEVYNKVFVDGELGLGTKTRCLVSDMKSFEHALIEIRSDFTRIKQALIVRNIAVHDLYMCKHRELQKAFMWTLVTNTAVSIFLFIAWLIKFNP
jgi:hypothetical protein